MFLQFHYADRKVVPVDDVDDRVEVGFLNPSIRRTFRDTDSMASSIAAAPKLLIV